jgi:hypothetical protein
VESFPGTLVKLLQSGEKSAGAETIPIYMATVQKTGEPGTRDPRYLSDDNTRPSDNWPHVQPGYCEGKLHDFEYGQVMVRVVNCNHQKPASS